MLVQEPLKKDPFSGHLFAFRGKKASMLKILFWDGNGLCLFTKRIDQGRFGWGLLPPIVSQRHSPPAPPKANPTTTIQEDRIRS